MENTDGGSDDLDKDATVADTGIYAGEDIGVDASVPDAGMDAGADAGGGGAAGYSCSTVGAVDDSPDASFGLLMGVVCLVTAGWFRRRNT